MWQTRCIGHTHLRVQTPDLEQGFGEPAVDTHSLEGNEKRRLFVSRAIIYFHLEINLLGTTGRKRQEETPSKEG